MEKALNFRKELGMDAIAYGNYEELLADPQIGELFECVDWLRTANLQMWSTSVC